MPVLTVILLDTLRSSNLVISNVLNIFLALKFALPVVLCGRLKVLLAWQQSQVINHAASLLT